ncbi:hypothetical protein [Bacillus horti]|uniref:Peptidoglycan hydrolase CwlO-like protein n=1 Tax=Caldalkalibacillus horti TaxID=77523 RepID=A0ABT9VVZ0_9BACI|nr:hypothetical protein [Bacillus horti]MDQ0165160.1 peptidoglycan hydrolase CwlO-like protein [Bacillus horti]
MGIILAENIVTSLVSLAGMFITGLFGYLVAKGKARKEFIISDRKLLSVDEKQFRAALMEELHRNRKEITSLRKEVENLRRMNINLELENKQLQAKIDGLRVELKRWEANDKKRM